MNSDGTTDIGFT